MISFSCYASKHREPTSETFSGGANSEKSERNGGGDLNYFVNLKAYPTNSMPFFLDNFCQILELGR